jgi:hypothetical protein
MEPLPYLSGTRPVNPGLLSRFLPVLEEGTVSGWLSSSVPPGSWVLDPFASSPRLALEAARLGYRVLVTVSNPITRFLLETAASAPSEADLKAALADLAAARKSDERLETHLRSLYVTNCERCGTPVQARAFLWNKDSDIPYARIYDCPNCEDGGERPAQPADLERVRELNRSALLHRARILERVAPVGDPDRAYAEEALQAYLPRAVYALATLINRMEGLDVAPERRRLITALALAAFDAGSSLWAAERPRPRQLTVSGQFRERNIWMALEKAVSQWSETSSPVAWEAWPKKIPEGGGISVFDGTLKEFATTVGREIPVAAVVAAVPRPNQAFWTLSALWAGWLWGREAAEPFKVGLRRRRYDWAWNATALSSAFKHLASILPGHAPMLALLSEPEPDFVTSAFMAADTSGFQLTGLALRDDQDPLQTVWTQSNAPRLFLGRDVQSTRTALDHYLGERAEPASYLNLHVCALAHLLETGAFKATAEEFDDVLRATRNLLEAVLTTDARFVHYSGGESYDTGMWGLHHYHPSTDSLADRVEMSMVQYMQKNPDRIFLEIEQDLYDRFRGLLTPSKGLIYNVLYSYAQRHAGAWRLREEDAPASRRDDLKQMSSLLESLGARLGYQTRQDGAALIWEEAGATERVFYLVASALVGRVVRNNSHPPEKCVVVLPGGRAALAAYKQQRDPALAESMKEWRLLKFRLLRSLVQIPVLNRQTFEEQMISDPVEQARGQLMMF